MCIDQQRTTNARLLKLSKRTENSVLNFDREEGSYKVGCYGRRDRFFGSFHVSNDEVRCGSVRDRSATPRVWFKKLKSKYPRSK